MRILLSAYACEPERGSEPGVGWNWAVQLASNLQYETFIITRSNNKKIINDFIQRNGNINNLFIFYYDLPAAYLWAKKHGLGTNLYYVMWQMGVVGFAKQLHAKYKFDLVHHITFGVFRDASLMYRLKIPLILGPLGGGEYTPPQLTDSFTFREKTKEFSRQVCNKIALFNPLLIKSLKHASIIFTKTPETQKAIPQKFHYKTFNYLEIGVQHVYPPPTNNSGSFIFVGRFIYLKGIDLLLHAFKIYLDHYDHKAILSLVGKGEHLKKIQKFISQYHLENNIRIIGWISQTQLKEYYQNATALLFPSLHDSSGNVVLEALSYGLPVICLDCGGPARVLGKSLEQLIVSTQNHSEKEITLEFAGRMNQLVSDISFFNDMRNKAIERANCLTWEMTVKNAYKLINKTINK